MDSNTLVVSQLTLGAIASWILQGLKNASWFPWLKEEGAKGANIVAALATSLASVTGLSYHYDGSAHTLMISGLSLTLVGNAVWHWASQFVIQEGWYQAVFNKKPVSVTPMSMPTTYQAGAVAGSVVSEFKK